MHMHNDVDGAGAARAAEDAGDAGDAGATALGFDFYGIRLHDCIPTINHQPSTINHAPSSVTDPSKHPNTPIAQSPNTSTREPSRLRAAELIAGRPSETLSRATMEHHPRSSTHRDAARQPPQPPPSSGHAMASRTSRPTSTAPTRYLQTQLSDLSLARGSKGLLGTPSSSGPAKITVELTASPRRQTTRIPSEPATVLSRTLPQMWELSRRIVGSVAAGTGASEAATRTETTTTTSSTETQSTAASSRGRGRGRPRASRRGMDGFSTRGT
ncbi:hypothetical protein E4U42_000363, partial [Claviceps africana]